MLKSISRFPLYSLIRYPRNVPIPPVSKRCCSSTLFRDAISPRMTKACRPKIVFWYRLHEMEKPLPYADSKPMVIEELELEGPGEV